MCQELCLEEYVDAAAKWCAEMGAVSLEEIAENIEDSHPGQVCGRCWASVT